ncbi:MAG: DUF177 domain-containing protein [Flammeovirgaceae bacterium]|nr:DUF177 domain-containing protein [Flammeovirgaceae bacterium]
METQSLPEGLHEFEWELAEEFFSTLPKDLLEGGRATVKVHLKKTSTMLQANFSIKGKLALVCDRSLDVFDFPYQIASTVFYKYSTEFKEVSEDTFLIPTGYFELDLMPNVLDELMLVIPPKKLHPRYQVQSFDDEATPKPFFSTSTDENELEKIDPRWEKLKKLKSQ